MFDTPRKYRIGRQITKMFHGNLKHLHAAIQLHGFPTPVSPRNTNMNHLLSFLNRQQLLVILNEAKAYDDAYTPKAKAMIDSARARASA